MPAPRLTPTSHRQPPTASPLRGDGHLPQSREQSPQRAHDAIVPLAQQRGEDVLAQLLAPQVVAAVAARVRRRVQVDPVILRAARDAVAAESHALAVQLQAALEPLEVDAARLV